MTGKMVKSDSTKIARLIMPMLKAEGLSVAAAEKELDLPQDALRNILRGRVQRDKARKIDVLQRVASRLSMDVTVLARAAGIVRDGNIDLGTPETQIKRLALAGGGDPTLCGTPLGMMAARGQIDRPWGIPYPLYIAGDRFARDHDWFVRTAGVRRAQTPLGRMLTDDAGHGRASAQTPEDDSSVDLARQQAYRGALSRLRASNAEAPFRMARAMPEDMVLSVAAACDTPAFLTSGKTMDDAPRDDVARWRNLCHGLSALARYYRSPDYMRLVQAMVSDRS